MTKCLVWFVGVFSQVDLYSSDIENATLNVNLIKDVLNTYDQVYCMVCCKTTDEMLHFEALRAKNEDLKNRCTFIYRGYGNFGDILKSKDFYDIFNGTLTHYLDSNTGRMNAMRGIFNYVKCIHVSKYLK